MSSLSKRLLPLYISGFLVSIPFWYAVEKLFMVSIGFNDATIGLMVAVMSTWILVVETPSGILADRWSRKGVLLLGCAMLGGSAVVAGVSQSIPIFIISTMLWGTFSALYSGTVESILYDTVLEEGSSSKVYKKYLARLRIVEGAGFVLGGLIGGLIAEIFTLRTTFFVSLIPVVMAVIILLFFREPGLHKQEVYDPLITHTKNTFNAILKNNYLTPIVVATVGFAVLLSTMFELNQLWLLASNTPTWVYGLAAAFIFLTWSLGGLIVERLGKHIHILMWLILIASLGLTFDFGYVAVITFIFLLCSCLVAVGIILSDLLQAELPSRFRAGATSFVSTMCNAIIIPLSLVFTAFSQEANIFKAANLLLILAVISVAAYLKIRPHKA